MVQDWPRDTFSRQQSFQSQCFPTDTAQRQTSFSSDRQPSSPHGQQYSPSQFNIDAGVGRMPHHGEVPRRPTLMQIDDALRIHCGIPGRRFFVAAISDDGSFQYHTSPGQTFRPDVVGQFFDAECFHNVINRVEAGVDPMLDSDDSPFGKSTFNRNRQIERRRTSVASGWESSRGQKKKRGRPLMTGEEEAAAATGAVIGASSRRGTKADNTMTTSSRRGIKVGDADAVWDFYQERFKNCQQTACKLIAKAWVKAVEPKKQSTHPYTGSDEKAPEWWPKPWGPTKDDKVRHKEPDHLYKRERVHLLAHILRLVVEPNGKQHADIRKLGLNVAKLEETTGEALSTFFMENDSNASKKPYLKEIFKMARSEERYRNGEIDGTTEIYVRTEDSVSDGYASDADDASFVKEEEDVDMTPPKTLHTETSSSTMHSAFMGDVPVRSSQFSQSQGMIPDMSSSHSYIDNSIQVHGAGMGMDMVTSPHDQGPGSRRPSVMSNFSSPVNPIYTQPWPTGSTGQNTPMYSYAPPQQPPMEQSGFVSPNVSMTSGHSFMAPFDGSQPDIFRPGGINGASSGQQAGFNDYISADSRAVMEQQHQQHL